ncbi:hypothetical protein ACU4HD_40740 [Cupriavidus basilensis]
MLNAEDKTYGEYTYREGATQQGDEPIAGQVIVARTGRDGFPTEPEQVIHVSGKFKDLNEAMAEAVRRVKAMIDGKIPGLEV